ncbi:hypothetical protein PGT21_005892 [Puccinia graminis f. sp. tritici]|uniref:PX domain-containing protein n=2 Tax=Puccinia graminis f. sp. tritici TaxID=56615 RepID=E3KTE1_PUCGT|nr:uncharacterized protein PGTG_13937 [Puccinia graminis f. sp. tritici CRL 75-36-700-3]EFP87566.1 hypothetical protein PGTG_13937 [Puccinia graminis f. sp. tritici CRL 75-36-700-3]KAA1086623.1 hypothetical protein PGT21_005892 [Puccinia graminis f. sp. tritici]
MAVMSDRTQTYFLSNSSSSLAPRKYSAPLGPYQPPKTSSAHEHLYGRGSLLPMPPNYNEGSCWTLASVRCLNPSPPDSRPRTIAVEVTKVSLRMDGRWAEEKPYIIEKTWEEWVDLREQLISRYPETESILPKLSKGQGFLESIFTNSKRSQNTQTSNMKELNSFLNCLVGKCAKKVLNSDTLHVFLQTEQMRAGVHQVEYTDDDLPLPRGPAFKEIPSRDDSASISSHLQAFRFPGPAPSPAPPHLKPKTSQPNLASRHMALGPEVEKPIPNERLSPHDRRRPTLDTMTVIAERPPPPGSIPDPQTGPILRSGTLGRTLAAPSTRLTNKSRNPLRPTTGVARPPPLAPPKRPTTSDSRLPHEAMLKPAMGTNYRSVCSPVAPTPARRPSELLLSFPREAEAAQLARPRLREFKSMQDIRATAGTIKASGRSGRNGLADPGRNNSVPAVGQSPQMVLQVRSPTNPWHRHRRTPSDSSSSFGSSQLSPISSVLSSPTVTPSSSNNSITKPIPNQQIQPKLTCRRSVDSLGPNSMKCDGASSLMVVPEREPNKIVVRPNVPPAPFYPIPPRISNSTANPLKANKITSTFPQSQKRPHTSAGNANGLKPSSLTLKVVHLESKTNIILAVQRGLFSLPQIKSKIQNKLKMAAEIELKSDWKIKLTMIDQEEFVRHVEGGEAKAEDETEDDGLKLVELINRKSTGSEIKKITLRIQ